MNENHYPDAYWSWEDLHEKDVRVKVVKDTDEAGVERTFVFLTDQETDITYVRYGD